MTPAELVAAAAEMLTEETHRYVERFTDCPNACDFEYDKRGELVRTAGPVDCGECDLGRVEDENATHLEPFYAELRQLATALAVAERAVRDLCCEDWPEHMTCGEAEDLSAVLSAFDPSAGAALVAAHAEGDDDPGDAHHAGGEAVAPAE